LDHSGDYSRRLPSGRLDRGRYMLPPREWGGLVLVPEQIHQCLFIENVILLLTHDKWCVQPLNYVNGNLYSGSAEGRALLIKVYNPYM